MWVNGGITPRILSFGTRHITILLFRYVSNRIYDTQLLEFPQMISALNNTLAK